MSSSLGRDQSNLKRLLMQKRNGACSLALWQGVTSYDLTNRKDVTVGSRNVSVSFPAAVSGVRLFDPLQSGNATKTWSRPTSVTVAVPDYPVIVEITR